MEMKIGKCEVHQNTIMPQQPNLADKLIKILIQVVDSQIPADHVINKLGEIFEMNHISVQDLALSNLLNSLKTHKPNYDPKGILESGQIHPELANRVENVLLEAREEGLNVFLFEGYRSIKRQNQLFQNGKGVTRASGGNSFHNYGLAADIVFYNQKGQPSWAEHHDWQTLGKIGKKWGLKWGGDFKSFNDRTHFEYHPGLSLRDVKKIYKKQGVEGVWNRITN